MTRSVLSYTTLAREEIYGEDVAIQDLTHKSFLNEKKKYQHPGYYKGMSQRHFFLYGGLAVLVFIAMFSLARNAPATSALQVRAASPEQAAFLRGTAATTEETTEQVVTVTAYPIAEPVVAPVLESNTPLDPEVFDEDDTANVPPVKVIHDEEGENGDDAKDMKRPPIKNEIEENEAQEEQEQYGLDTDETQNDIMVIQPKKLITTGNNK